MNDQITRASDVALPIEIVTLEHLRTLAGEPVQVRCEMLDEVTMADLLGPPGARPSQAGEAADDPEISAGLDDTKIRRINDSAPILLPAATALLGDDGALIRPAFYFTDAQKVPGAIDGRYLRLADRALLVSSILKLSGLGGAAGAEFHGGKREGGGNGVGDLAPGEGDGDTAAPAAGEGAVVA